MNPYRDVFFSNQASWHGYKSAEDILRKHEIRRPFYKWFTAGWLPTEKNARFLDIGCGAGQFIYFLNKSGYSDAVGIDLDAQQVALGVQAGIQCKVSDVETFLQAQTECFDCVSILDVLEHFTNEEMFRIVNLVAAKLKPDGAFIVSVPNAASPLGFWIRCNDITHESAFSATMLGEMARCHGMSLKEVRDPWPAPIDFPRMVYRRVALISRWLEGMRYRLLGLRAPDFWCPVVWALIRKDVTANASRAGS